MASVSIGVITMSEYVAERVIQKNGGSNQISLPMHWIRAHGLRPGDKVKVVYNGAKPDMLKDEAQAILTGKLDSEGVFIAEELLLKCPTKYEEALPEQAENVNP